MSTQTFSSFGVKLMKKLVTKFNVIEILKINVKPKIERGKISFFDSIAEIFFLTRYFIYGHFDHILVEKSLYS